MKNERQDKEPECRRLTLLDLIMEPTERDDRKTWATKILFRVVVSTVCSVIAALVTLHLTGF